MNKKSNIINKLLNIFISIMKIFLLLILFTSLYSIDEIKYLLARGFLGRFIDRFSVRFNRFEGIQAEYVKGPKIKDFKD